MRLRCELGGGEIFGLVYDEVQVGVAGEFGGFAEVLFEVFDGTFGEGKCGGFFVARQDGKVNGGMVEAGRAAGACDRDERLRPGFARKKERDGIAKNLISVFSVVFHISFILRQRGHKTKGTGTFI